MNRTVESYPVSIFIAGDPNEAADCCRAYCDEVGYCVTVSQALYVFRGGEEEGVVIGLINYGRFPAEPEAIFQHAYRLGERLCAELKQESYTIQATDKTLWVSHRPADNPPQASTERDKVASALARDKVAAMRAQGSA
jgi:hypothetical protein